MRARLSALGSWRKHEQRVLEVFRLALDDLLATSGVPESENEVNRRLCFCVRRANRRLLDIGKGIPWPIVYECRNQPLGNDVERAAREDKRPDFLWGFVDLQETNWARADMFFAIECKRLGERTSPKWVLNENYVAHGIVRFSQPAHGYGAGTPSGAMVGYVQSMDPIDVLAAVNASCACRGLPHLRLSCRGWQAAGISSLQHAFSRTFDVSPFTLHHLWADLRTP